MRGPENVSRETRGWRAVWRSPRIRRVAWDVTKTLGGIVAFFVMMGVLFVASVFTLATMPPARHGTDCLVPRDQLHAMCRELERQEQLHLEMEGLEL